MGRQFMVKIKAGAKCAIKRILDMFPLRNIIIFESNPDFEDNTYWFYKYLVEQKHIQKKYKLVWFLADMNNARKELLGAKIICVDHLSDSIKWRMLRRYYLQNAKLIVDCNRVIDKTRKRQLRVFLGHGMPLKITEGYVISADKVDVVPILGDGFRTYYEKKYISKTVFTVGYPRNEVLFSSMKSDIKFIVWMPTYRQHKTNLSYRMEENFPLGIPVIKKEEELNNINQVLKDNNMYLLIRPHPAQDLSFFRVANYENILLANDAFLKDHKIKLYELLAQSYGLITDYSSVYYDYLITGKPIGLTFEDAKEFSAKWSFFFGDIEQDIKGYKINTVNDLIAFIDDTVKGIDPYRNERERLKKELGISEYPASELIYKMLEKRLFK